MATTKNTKDKGKDKTPPDPNALRVELQHGDSQSEKLAALATDGALTAITLQAYSGGGKELGVTELLAPGLTPRWIAAALPRACWSQRPAQYQQAAASAPRAACPASPGE